MSLFSRRASRWLAVVGWAALSAAGPALGQPRNAAHAVRQAPAPTPKGREVEAPAWSFACMTDHGPTPCHEPMWVYD
jgi:hypothetical protein